MNELTLYGDRKMTVKEMSEALNISERTIQEHAKAMFPGYVRNGMTTMLDEYQVTAIKKAVEKSGRNDLANVREVAFATTALEIEEMTLKVISYHKAEADRLRSELSAAKPAIESHAALMRSEKTMSITQCAKHFGVHPKTEVFPYLRARGYLTSKDLPSQDALDADILALVETRDRYTDAIYPQAVVRVCQLEKWRTVVIPNIEKWKEE